MRPGISTKVPFDARPAESWAPSFPNPADLAFDYDKLMRESPEGLATFEGQGPSVAIVGGGVAGMVAARELYRSGCRVTVFEASARIGGRLYTRPSPYGDGSTGMEMGAMRMPFFTAPGSNNCLLDYFLVHEPAATGQGDAKLEPFPNPGQAAGGTGIYLNGGLGPQLSFARPQLIPWDEDQPIGDPDLADISNKFKAFSELFTTVVKSLYATSEWPDTWARIIERYDGMTFGDLVMAPARDTYEGDGDFGGFGMNAGQSDLLYTIGIGDGSWGAFYGLASLWFMRCTFFGFSTDLQTVVGLPGAPVPAGPLLDSAGRAVPSPTYAGIQSVPEYLLFCRPPGERPSLYQAVREGGAGLFLEAPVRALTKTPTGIEVETARDDVATQCFDHVIVTSPQWASQMSFQYRGFDEGDVLPRSIVTARNVQHNISSCKLFFPLREPYWLDPECKIPQVIISDTYIQDVYGLTWTTGPDDKGVILASYTWEDDSLKLLPYGQEQLADLVLAKLRQITTETVGQDVTQYIDRDHPVHIQWISEPHYHGCAKLYRERNWDENFGIMSYNQEHSAHSHLYFAGENYSLEGGWTEPALRTAVDAVLHVIRNAGGTPTAPGFVFDRDYPRWTRYVTVTTEFLPPAKAGSSYTTKLEATGGVEPYVWAADGELPRGLTLSADGELSGTPVDAGSDLSFEVSVADASTPPQHTRQPFVFSVTR